MRYPTPMLTLLGFLLLCGFAADQPRQRVFISTQTDISSQLVSKSRLPILSSKVEGTTAVLEVDAKDIHTIAHFIHERTGRCGGFFVEPNPHSAFAENTAPVNNEIRYNITQQETIKAMIELVDEPAIRASIKKLSSFRNRYYKSQHGVDSQEWVRDRWKELTADREDVQVRLVEHEDWLQPSVELKITGTDKPEEYVVLGGHGDSISGWFPDTEVFAPGADDNASGIAVLTEVLRVLGKHPERKPKRSLLFYSYAAEEVGLRGSDEIAKQAKSDDKAVLAVMQLDMTNFEGSDEDLVFISDNTDSSLTRFGEELVAAYLPDIEISRGPCGYACSDHASWTRQGFRAVFPFESNTDRINRAIHTHRDTLSNSGNHANHAVPFAKLAIAFAIELGLGNLELEL